MKDLANELGLSVSTVSRSLRDRYDISPTVKQRVTELARQRGYRPNSLAQALANRSTKLIGIIVPDFVSNFYAYIINGIEEEVRKQGYYAVVASSHESFQREVESINHMLDLHVCGLIICLSQETNDYTHLRDLAVTGLPVVYVDRVPDSPEFYRVVSDNETATYNLIRHLIEQGASKIAFILGPAYLKITAERKKGYLDALHDAGIPADEKRIIQSPLGSYDGMEILKELDAVECQYDAVVCMNETILYGLMLEVRKRGLRIPEDIKLVGFTDEFHSRLICPGLTVVAHQTYEMGKKAAEKLFEFFREHRYIKKEVVCPCSLYIAN